LGARDRGAEIKGEGESTLCLTTVKDNAELTLKLSGKVSEKGYWDPERRGKGKEGKDRQVRRNSKKEFVRERYLLEPLRKVQTNHSLRNKRRWKI